MLTNRRTANFPPSRPRAGLRQGALAAVVAAGLLGAGAAQATGGVLGLSAGANIWFHDPDGDVEFDGDEIGLDSSSQGLGLDSDNDANLWIQWNHVIPAIPSVRLEHTNLGQTGSGTLNAEFGGKTFNTDVDSDLTFDQTDLTLFWTPIPLPYVDIDIGINVKYVDGELIVEGEDGTEASGSFSGPVPMAYGRLGVDIPGTRIRGEASVKTLPVSDASLTDTQIQLIYKFWYSGLTVGYRDISVDFDDFDDFTIDASFSGPYAGAFLRF